MQQAQSNIITAVSCLCDQSVSRLLDAVGVVDAKIAETTNANSKKKFVVCICKDCCPSVQEWTLFEPTRAAIIAERQVSVQSSESVDGINIDVMLFFPCRTGNRHKQKNYKEDVEQLLKEKAPEDEQNKVKNVTLRQCKTALLWALSERLGRQDKVMLNDNAAVMELLTEAQQHLDDLMGDDSELEPPIPDLGDGGVDDMDYEMDDASFEEDNAAQHAHQAAQHEEHADHQGQQLEEAQHQEEPLGRGARMRVVTHALASYQVNARGMPMLQQQQELEAAAQAEEAIIQQEADATERERLDLDDTKLHRLLSTAHDEGVFPAKSAELKQILESRMLINDGATEIYSHKHDLDAIPEEVKEDVLSWMCIEALECINYGHSLNSLTSKIKRYKDSANKGCCPLKDGVAENLPSSAAKVFDCLSHQYGPKLFRHMACPCGKLKRGPLGKLDRCPCGGEYSINVEMFSVIDSLQQMWKIPVFAEAMRYEENRPRPTERVYNSETEEYETIPLITDVYDQPFWKAVIDDPTLSDVRHVKLELHSDGWLSIALLRGSASITMSRFNILNLPPHLRRDDRFKICIGAIIKGQLKNMDDIHQVAMDEINKMYYFGHEMLDGFTKEKFLCRALLIKSKCDSRENRHLHGAAEPGSYYASYHHNFKGMTIKKLNLRGSVLEVVEEESSEEEESSAEEDSSDEESNEEESNDGDDAFDFILQQRQEEVEELVQQDSNQEEEDCLIVEAANAKKLSTVMYPDLYRFLSLDHSKRQELSTLHHIPGEAIDTTSYTSPSPEELRAAAISLRVNPSPEEVEAAQKLGLVRYSPLWWTSTWNVQNANFDSMHAVGNVVSLLLNAGLGDTMEKSVTWKHILTWERLVNKRFPDSDLPYKATAEEELFISQRAHMAMKMLPQDLKGTKAPLAMTKNSSGSLIGVKTSDKHQLCSPLGLYLIDGAFNRLAQFGPDSEINMTYCEIYTGVLWAINDCRQKTYTVGEKDAAETNLTEALVYFAASLPISYSRHTVYQLIQVGEHLPFHTNSCFSDEAGVQFCRKLTKSKRHLIANLLRNIKRFMGVSYMELDLASDTLRQTLLQSPDYTNLTLNNRIKVEPGGEEGTVRLDIPTKLSIWQHFLQDKSHCTYKELRCCYDDYLSDGGTDIIKAIGEDAKFNALQDFHNYVLNRVNLSEPQPWAHNRSLKPANYADTYRRYLIIPSSKRSYGDMAATSVSSYSRLKAGPASFRTKALDEGRNSTESFYFAKVESNGDHHFELGRALNFLAVSSPGASADQQSLEHQTIFILCEWMLLPDYERYDEMDTVKTTTVTGLPIVLMPDGDKHIKTDKAVKDELLPRVWNAASIYPYSVGLVPLDINHNVPDDIHFTMRGYGATVQGKVDAMVSRYARGLEVPGTATNPEPFNPSTDYRLGAVVSHSLNDLLLLQG